MLLFTLILQLALSQCPSDTYFDTYRGICLPCGQECLTCTSSSSDASSNCLTCTNPMQIPDSGNCHFPCEILNNCNICSTQCEICEQTQCNHCFAPYKLLLPSCVEDCPSGYFELNSQCFKCDISCEECIGSSKNCTICSTGFVNNSGICTLPYCGDGLVTTPEECDDAVSSGCFNCTLITCNFGSYLNQTEKKCDKCDEACLGCIGSGDMKCTQCRAGYILLNQQCVVSVCGDGVVAFDEECDEISENCINCRTVQCVSPEIVHKEYYQDFSGFSVLFNSEVSCQSCSAFSNSELFGKNSICYSDQDTIHIIFGLNPTITYLDSIEIKQNSISRCNPFYKFYLQGSDPKFTINIIGNNILTSCTTDLKLTPVITSSSIRDLISFNWSVSPYSESISNYLSMKQPVIPRSYLLDSNYTFEFRGTDFLNDTIAASFLVSSSSANAPIIFDPEVYQASLEVPLLIRVDAINCNDSRVIEFDWQVISGDQFRLEKYNRILKVYNDFYIEKAIIRVWAWTDATNKAYKDIPIIFVFPKVQAIIKPRCVNSTIKPIRFEAKTQSFYSNRSSDMQYWWKLMHGNQVIATGDSYEFNLDTNKTGRYLLELKIKGFGTEATDNTEIVLGDEGNSSVEASSRTLTTDGSIYYKIINAVFPINSNLLTKSLPSDAYQRFNLPSSPGHYYIMSTPSCQDLIKTESEPDQGFFYVHPASGVSFSTLFTLSAVNWNSAYLYQYFLSIDNDFIPLTDKVFHSSFSTYLPHAESVILKLRVYSIGGSYTERIKYIKIVDGGKTAIEMFDNVMKRVPERYFEMMLQSSVVFAEMISKENQCEDDSQTCNDKESACKRFECKDINMVIEKLNSVCLQTSIELPNSEFIDNIVLVLLERIVRKGLQKQKIPGVILVLLKRLRAGATADSLDKIFKVSNELLRLLNEQQGYEEFFSEIVNIMIEAGRIIAMPLAEEPPVIKHSGDLALQASHIYLNYSTIRESTEPYSVFKVKASSPTELIIINANLSKLIKTVSKDVICSVYVQMSKKSIESGVVSLPDLNQTDSFICHYSEGITKSSKKLSGAVFCEFSESGLIYLTKSRDYALKFNFLHLIFLGLLVFIDILWCIWGFKRDRREEQQLSRMPAVSHTFKSAICNCHCILSLFYRYDFYLSRISRIFIVNCKLFMSFIVVSLMNSWIGMCVGSFSGYLIGNLLQRMLKTRVKGVKIDKEPQIPRYSPSVGLPDIQVKYSHVRNQSETNSDPFTYLATSSLSKVLKIISLITGLCLASSCFYLSLVTSVFRYQEFLASISIDLLLLHPTSIALQFFVFSRSTLLLRFTSRTIQELTESSVIING